jgi:lipid-binding SYLF domain-containing protein
MTRNLFFSVLLGAWALLAPTLPAQAQTAELSSGDKRLNTASEVLDELRNTPDQRVPDWLMQGAFIFGGRYGNGVLLVRDSADRFSSNPIFVRLAGGSVGWQVGATATDVVLVFVTPRSVENFARGKVTLGVNASVAAGPLGRQADAAGGINVEVYSYSRSRGLFAGVALDGTVLAFDGKANQFFYNNEYVNTEMITSGKVTTHSDAAHRFVTAVTTSTRDAASVSPPAAQAAPPAGVAPSAAPAGPAPSGVKTYPMEDTHPGGEPK